MKLPMVAACGWLLCVLFLMPMLAAAQVEQSREPFNRGVALQRKGDLAGAQLAYEEALKLAPSRVDTLSNLGLVHLHQGKNEKAIEYLGKALSLNSALHTVRMFLGLAYFRTGQVVAAQGELTKVLEAQPAHPQALHLLGLCLLKRDQIQEGITVLQAALQANPNNADAAYTLATAYVGSGEIERAEALLEGPLQQKNSAEMHLVRGTILNAKRAAKEALAELLKAQQLNQMLPTLRTQMGYAYLLLMESEKATHELLIALQQAPTDIHANAYLGWMYIQEKRYPEATERLTAVLHQQPENATILYQLGQIQHLTGQVEQAGETLERAAKLKPNLIPTHVLLARVYSKLKRPDDFKREQSIIRQLTEREQELNLGTPEKYVEQENTFPKFVEGLAVKPYPRNKAPQ